MLFNIIRLHDLEGQVESLAEQGFQPDPFFRSGTKKWRLASSPGELTFQVVSVKDISLLFGDFRVESSAAVISDTRPSLLRSVCAKQATGQLREFLL